MSTWRRRLPVVLGGLALVAVVVAVVAFVSGDDEEPPPEATYDEDVERAFVESCSADGGDDVEPVCECFYEGIASSIPYARYAEVNDELLASPPPSGEPVELPDDFDEILRECRASTPEPEPPATARFEEATTTTGA
jgi:hypothetical protein